MFGLPSWSVERNELAVEQPPALGRNARAARFGRMGLLILNAIGGRKRVRGLLCKPCNQPERLLAKRLKLSCKFSIPTVAGSLLAGPPRLEAPLHHLIIAYASKLPEIGRAFSWGREIKSEGAMGTEVYRG